ncbi:MAG: hypothetical protein ACTSPY_12705 [Candidatus Helarchaeota archaeon]
MVSKFFKEALNNIKNILEVKDIAIYDGEKIKFSSFNNKEILKILKMIGSTINNLGFDIEPEEFTIMNNNQMLKLFIQGKNIVIIKFSTNKIINKSLIDEGVKTLFQYISS